MCHTINTVILPSDRVHLPSAFTALRKALERTGMPCFSSNDDAITNEKAEPPVTSCSGSLPHYD